MLTNPQQVFELLMDAVVELNEKQDPTAIAKAVFKIIAWKEAPGGVPPICTEEEKRLAHKAKEWLHSDEWITYLKGLK